MPCFVLCYNKLMLAYDYYNAAILSVRETTNGVDKLEKLPNETRRQFNERRKARLLNLAIRKNKGIRK